MTPVAPAPGLSVAGKYELIRPLARGSMGQVWVARHATLEGELAIKFMNPATGADSEDAETAMARFRFEAQVAARLARKTRHIISVSDHGVEWGWAYLVMELIDGESLEARMHRQGRLDLPTVAQIIGQIAKGLTQAHAEGLFHRDLKPANVLLTRDEEGGLVAKILDFGIAKATRKHPVTREGARTGPGHETEAGIVLGTPNYMSPEQARGLSNLDHRCDVWALATVAFEALTGTLPYDGETTADLLVNICTVESVPVRTFRPDLPPSADAVFAKAFRRKISERYQQAHELADALNAVEVEARVVTKKTSIIPGPVARESRETEPELLAAPPPMPMPMPMPKPMPIEPRPDARALSAIAPVIAPVPAELRPQGGGLPAETLQGNEVDAPLLKARTTPLVVLAIILAAAIALLLFRIVAPRASSSEGPPLPTPAASSDLPETPAAPTFTEPQATSSGAASTTVTAPAPPGASAKPSLALPPTAPTSTATRLPAIASKAPPIASTALPLATTTAPPPAASATKKVDKGEIL